MFTEIIVRNIVSTEVKNTTDEPPADGLNKREQKDEEKKQEDQAAVQPETKKLITKEMTADEIMKIIRSKIKENTENITKIQMKNEDIKKMVA
mmetsp:Transcript_23762/g.27324  ORF Transcript_23762/g.27324 Transcript_23762/m.27324 type:complete len:93 (+) Transcript_23762:303-581(+)